MDIIPSRFTDEQVGLEAPPEDTQAPCSAVGAPEGAAVLSIVITCPNCGGNDAVQQADDASVAECPQCQCQFGAGGCPGGDSAQVGVAGRNRAGTGLEPGGPEEAFPMESAGLGRILGKVFESHVRHLTAGQRKSVSQHQPKLPGK